MKTSEFIKSVEDLGFRTSSSSISTRVKDTYNDTVAYVSERHMNVVDTDFADFITLMQADKGRLLKLITEYSQTTISKRAPEPRYVYKKPELLSGGGYLNIIDYDTDDERIIFSTYDQHMGYITQFTDNQVEALSSIYHPIFAMCEKINVEEL